MQQQFVDEGVARRTVNQYVDVMRRMFKWAASKELFPVVVYTALTTVPGLKSGRAAAAKEPVPIMPVENAVVDATLPAFRRSSPIWSAYDASYGAGPVKSVS